MKIFWSWQSDHDKATGNYFVRDALKQAAKELGRELEISERIEVDHDTKGVPGRPPIVQTIFDKIEAARAFVADVTPVGETAAGKPLPNPNVMIELGYARRSRGHERLIFVANGQHLKKPEDLPFDLRGDRGPAMYTLAEGADAATMKAAEASLVAALKLDLRAIIAFDESVRSAALLSTIEVETDKRSKWFADDETLTCVDQHRRGAKKEVRLPPGPHAFMRIKPAHWPEEVRTASLSPDQFSESLALGHGRNGDWGQSNDGFLSYWYHDTSDATPKSVNVVTEWAAKDGVAWSVWSGILSQHSPPFFYWLDMMRFWAYFLQHAIDAMIKVKARGPFRVDAGVVGISGVRWGEAQGSSGTAAIANEVRRSSIRVTAELSSQHEFLAALFNRLTDAFGSTREITSDQIPAILNQ